MLAWADDAVVAELLARIRQSGPAEYHYRETRHMELLDAPVHAEGYMLTDAEGTLVKLQLQPSRVIMAIAGQSMFYWDPGQNQRHSAPVSRGGSAVRQVAVFRAILRGRVEELNESYRFDGENKDGYWTLRLTPKPGSMKDTPGVEIVGDADDKQRKIAIRQADGESTEYLIDSIGGDRAAQYSISALLREVSGD